MSDPIRVGGPWTCKGCGQWSDGSDYHECPNAARPKVSEDDEKAARELFYRWWDEPTPFTVAVSEFDRNRLIATITSDRASVRLAERNRIREAVEKLNCDYPGIDAIRTAIDGHPDE